MAADDPMMRLRLPPELKRRIAEAAREANRSMNAEIIQRLEQSFILSGASSNELAAQYQAIDQRLREISARLAREYPERVLNLKGGTRTLDLTVYPRKPRKPAGGGDP